MNNASDRQEPIHRRHTHRLQILAVLALGLLLGLSACISRDDYRADHGVPPCEITGPLDTLLSEFFPDGEPGAILAVMRGDSIVYDHAFGYADMETMERITDSTSFNVVSTSKLFSGAALLKLEEMGLIDLDQNLHHFFPELPEKLFGKITVRHILSHSTGLFDLRPRDSHQWRQYLTNHKSVFGYGPDYRIYGTEREHMQIFSNMDTLEFEPGTMSQRYDPGFILVAPLLEKVTGCDYDTWMYENIFVPAGLTETFYLNPDCKYRRMAHGYAVARGPVKKQTYRSDDGRWDEYDYGETDFFLTKADRGLYSSVRDIFRFQRMLYSGKVLSDSILTDMLTPRVKSIYPGVVYCLATSLKTYAGIPPKFYHTGFNGGFSTIECSWPDKGVHYILLANRRDWDREVVSFAIDSILKAHHWL